MRPWLYFLLFSLEKFLWLLSNNPLPQIEEIQHTLHNISPSLLRGCCVLLIYYYYDFDDLYYLILCVLYYTVEMCPPFLSVVTHISRLNPIPPPARSHTSKKNIFLTLYHLHSFLLFFVGFLVINDLCYGISIIIFFSSRSFYDDYLPTFILTKNKKKTKQITILFQYFMCTKITCAITLPVFWSTFSLDRHVLTIWERLLLWRKNEWKLRKDFSKKKRKYFFHGNNQRKWSALPFDQ